jgi:hypothetical protein
MEELSTLATGFEVDGGQLRYQLYVWLEREVEALRQLCNYSAGELDSAASRGKTKIAIIEWNQYIVIDTIVIVYYCVNL